MAVNIKFTTLKGFPVPGLSNVKSGDFVRIGALNGIAMADTDENGMTTVNFGTGYAIEASVEANQGDIAFGDMLGHDPAGKPPLSNTVRTAAGVGVCNPDAIAMGTVANTQTAIILVAIVNMTLG
jgi:hypothetical protein